ncbi:MAG: tryptophan--tRNA ligase [Candidatus Woesearchaeota archaeon]
MKNINPWSDELPKDYQEIINKFGFEKFNVNEFPNPNHLMRRSIIYAGRGLKIISECIKQKKDYYVLSGIMTSSEKIHFGTKSVIDMISYFQKNNAQTYVCIADLEALCTRNISLEESKKRALDFHIPIYLALGLDIKKTTFYFQSENKNVMHLSYAFSSKVTLNEYRAIYGNSEPSRIFAALTQSADILFPQTIKRMPGIIPVGVDQDPHIRLTRDIVARSKDYKFFTPSSIYNKFVPSLDGSLKMSKSNPNSAIFLPEDKNSACRKIMSALTGGRKDVEEQRKNGGIPENCMVFELYKQHLIEDDKQLSKVYDECKTGKILCGECKKNACELMGRFFDSLNEKFIKAKEEIGNAKILRFE